MNKNLSSILKVFSESWKFYIGNFWIITKILIIPVLIYLISIFINIQVISESGQLFSLLLAIISSILLFLSNLALLKFITHKEQIQNWWKYYQQSIRYFWSYFWIIILMDVAMLGGFILLIIPGIVLINRIQFAPFVLFDQEKRGLSSLALSSYYVKSNWWKVFWRLLILFLMVFLVSLVFTFMFNETQIIFILLEIFLSLFIITPFVLIYLYTIYKELKHIKTETITAIEESKSKKALKIYSILGLVGYIVIIILLVIGLKFVGSALVDKKLENSQLVKNKATDSQILFNIESMMVATEFYLANNEIGLNGTDTEMKYIRPGEKLYEIHKNSSYYAGDESVLAEIKACVQGDDYIISSDRELQLPTTGLDDNENYFHLDYFAAINGSTDYPDKEPTCETMKDYQR